MALLINLRRLEKDNVTLRGELAAEELDLAGVDELIRVEQPVEYDLEAEKLDRHVLVCGSLKVVLRCECARCLKPFQQELEFKDWACHLPLEGDEKVLIANDCVDLTPYLREDILLEFPQHPLCEPECRGLPVRAAGKAKKKKSGTGQGEGVSSAWAELNKLKF